MGRFGSTPGARSLFLERERPDERDRPDDGIPRCSSLPAIRTPNREDPRRLKGVSRAAGGGRTSKWAHAVTLGIVRSTTESTRRTSGLREIQSPGRLIQSRPGLCRTAGGRGMGEPARHNFNARPSFGFRAPGGFLLSLALPPMPARPAQPTAPPSTAWVVRSGAKSSTPSISSICASFARARCTRLLIVPTRQPQISAASS